MKKEDFVPGALVRILNSETIGVCVSDIDDSHQSLNADYMNVFWFDVQETQPIAYEDVKIVQP